MVEEITIDLVTSFLKEEEIELKSTHDKLSFPIILRLYKKMKYGIKFKKIDVCDDWIINGHHRYLASLLADIKIDKGITLKSSAKELCDWKEVELVEEDWDNDADIEKFNKEDAEYSGIELNEIIELTRS